MRRRPFHREAGWWVGAAALAAALAAWSLQKSSHAPSSGPAPAAEPRSSSGQGGRPTRADTVVLPPATGRAVPPIRLSPPYEVSDGLTILTATRRVRLAGLEGPAAEAACYDPDDRLWACGLQARAALVNLIRGEAVACQPTGESRGEAILARCASGDRQLDRELVRQGFARPRGERGSYERDLEDAKNNGRGLWRGGWRVRESLGPPRPTP